MKKRFVCMLAALLILTFCLPASAASLVGSSAGIGQRISPTTWVAQYNGSTLPSALDDNSSTCWSFSIWSGIASDSTPEATFYFSGETLTTVWMRAGNYRSINDYFNNAFPTQVRLRIHMGSGSVDYNYQLDDLYDTITSSENWKNGYQSLQLPVPAADVRRVELFILTWRGGSTGNSELCISDIAFSGQAGVPTTTQPISQTGGGINTTLIMRLATRSGPSTKYTGLGSYFKEGAPVKVLTKAFDYSNGIWWVQVEFTYQGTLRRAYTGLKRVNVDIDRVPEEKQLGSATVKRAATAYYGPGTAYTRYKNAVPAYTTGTVWNRENGYVQFEYINDSGTKVRVWLSSNDVNMY
ncbi:MAG: hypothetical protein IJK28_11795 [Clostridia bacterium]|nr:hypothetical protein [Clostridia bacterium]